MRNVLILGLAAVCCQVVAPMCLAVSSTNGHRLLVIYPVQRAYSLDDDMILCYRLTNCAEHDYYENMPYENGGLVWDWFDVYLNGRKLPNRLAGKDYGFLKKTRLGPGESVTIIFSVRTLCDLPAKAADRVGHYEVRARALTDHATPFLPVLTANVADFWVVERRDEIESEGIMSLTLSDASLGRAFLCSERAQSANKLKYLRLLQKQASHDSFLNLLGACSDAYALTVLVESIGADIATPEYLFQFLESRDLSIRRACLRNLAARHLTDEQRDRLITLWKKGDQIVDELVEKIMAQ